MTNVVSLSEKRQSFFPTKAVVSLETRNVMECHERAARIKLREIST